MIIPLLLYVKMPSALAWARQTVVSIKCVGVMAFWLLTEEKVRSHCSPSGSETLYRGLKKHYWHWWILTVLECFLAVCHNAFRLWWVGFNTLPEVFWKKGERMITLMLNCVIIVLAFLTLGNSLFLWYIKWLQSLLHTSFILYWWKNVPTAWYSLTSLIPSAVYFI